MSTALVVTSINAPNTALRALAAGCHESDWKFIVAGDSKSPPDFQLDGCAFLSLEAQLGSGFSLAEICPQKSYTRKNLGYLTAIEAGAKVIVETDDDNHPRPEFWIAREKALDCRPAEMDGWVNAYQYFSDKFIYPRGLPLVRARDMGPVPGAMATFECPIQQGLADNDPDVDAVYRMLYPLPFNFDTGVDPVLLTNGAWCPFNSQNTTFFEEVFPLLYLPAFCSFRMTDIWRGFVASRILQAQGKGILYHSATVWQERNEHDLQRDFIDELPGYSHNEQIRHSLLELPLAANQSIRSMMEVCYESMIRNGWVGANEEDLLQAWFSDLEALNSI
jgi:hypothetical protein